MANGRYTGKFKTVISYLLTDRKMPDAMEPKKFLNKAEARSWIYFDEYGKTYNEKKHKGFTLNKLLKNCGYKLKCIREKVLA